MKVLKFGGTSVGTAASLANVKSITDALTEPAIVVVSALGGITDKLIVTAKLAEAHDSTYLDCYEAIVSRHDELIDELFDGETAAGLHEDVGALLAKLGELYKGVYLLEDLSDRTLDEIVSFGERMSSLIVVKLLPGAKLYNSLDFFRTYRQQDKDFLTKTMSTITEQLEENRVNVDELASALAMSTSQFRRRLSALTGETPQSYITNIRMQKARHLLDTHSELTVLEVALQCGYDDQSSFTRAFKRFFGITPSEYLQRSN